MKFLQKEDWIKVFPLFAINFLLSFSYYILKSLKDALVITAKGSGAEAIPFIKVWLLVPTSFLMVLGFTWLTRRYPFKVVFYLVNGFFLLFFFLFTFGLYPYQEAIHPHAIADQLQDLLPSGGKGLVAVFRNWSFSLFYVLAECWTAIVYYVLFWGFANAVTSLSQAQRIYPLLVFSGNVSAIVAGKTSAALSSTQYAWDQSVVLLTSVLLVCGLAVVAIFRWRCEAFTQEKMELQKAKPLPFWESMNLLRQSKPLIAIALVVFCFNIITNLMEVVWKDRMSAVYPDPNVFHAFLSNITVYIGILSTVLTLFVCSRSLCLFGWTFTAMLTPLLTLLSGGLFFSTFLGGESTDLLGLAAAFATSPLAVSGFLGALHICVLRSMRYSLLDVTKEMAFIPLPSEQKLSGKAAVDGIGSRLGKGSSSVIFQFLFLFLPSVAACVPYIAMIFLLAIVVCFLSILFLGKGLERKELAIGV